ncbi:10241_t:CDS:2, partial [Cetraspora pellucida]
MDLTHTLVSSIFLETHSEIYLLAKEFNQLKTFYQMNDDYELELKETLEKEESPLENIESSNIEQQFDNQILMTLQIEKFQKIFAQHTIKEDDNDIKPIVHALIGRKSSHALSFATILNVLTFIVNFANYHGLPSPGCHFLEDTMAITFLPASESYVVLYCLYQSSLDETSDLH